jgi:hypothetical protein
LIPAGILDEATDDIAENRLYLALGLSASTITAGADYLILSEDELTRRLSSVTAAHHLQIEQNSPQIEPGLGKDVL